MMKELSFEEMEMITGGGWLGDAWDWIKNAVVDVAEAIADWFREEIARAAIEYARNAYEDWRRGGSAP